MDQDMARRIIETLRSGVPSREVSATFTIGREQLLDTCREDLTEVAQGASVARIIRGPYGSGKSHLLSAVDNIARAQGFAVSSVVISKEMPVNRFNKVYEALAHALSCPRLRRSGFEDLLMEMRPGGNRAEDIRQYVEQHLHRKLHYVFMNYLQASDPLQQSQLYDDLAGTWISIGTLRSIHRSNFGEPLRMQRFLHSDTQHYFRFLSFILRRTQHPGWVLLIDELELLSKLGIGARAEAYVNLGLLLGLDPERTIEGVYTVLAMASPFIQNTLTGSAPGSRQNDLQEVPGWLRSHGKGDDADLAYRTMRKLTDDNTPLTDLTNNEENTRRILDHVEANHRIAYAWDGALNHQCILPQTSGRPVRTTIRAALEYLDLTLQYGVPPDDIIVSEPETESYGEDSNYQAGDDTTEN